jgi:hypothetical protein
MLKELSIGLSWFLLNFRIPERQEKKRIHARFIGMKIKLVRWKIEKRFANIMDGDSMVTKNITYRWRGRPWRKQKLCIPLVLLVLLGMGIDILHAQSSFVNSGTFKNTGTFRIKHAVAGLPDTVGGTFEYFGGNQTVQSTNYTNLALNGASSTKTTSGTNFSIIQTVSVASDVTMNVSSGTMTLAPAMGRLTENGAVLGKVSKMVDFSATSDSSDIGGIGVFISYNGTPLGSTTVQRVSGTAVNTNAIQRSFTITPSVSTSFAGTLKFKYANDELAGQNQNALELWRSVDGGATWRRQRTDRNTSAMQLANTGSSIGGIWTAADTLHMLGRKNYEGNPDSVSAVSADSLRGKAHAILNPFIAHVTDVYGNPISGAKVRLMFGTIPSGASGYSVTDSLGVTDLTNAVVTTDHAGTVKMRLHLGNKKGSYHIIARVDSISSAQLDFIGYADAGVAAFATLSTPSADTVKTVLTPLVLQAKDEDSLFVPGVNVKFAITSAPAGATKQSLVVADTMTDGSGNAYATLRLGEKSGWYTVKVTTNENDSIAQYYSVKATHGTPTFVWKRSASAYTDTIGSTLSKFSYAVTDIDTNAVNGQAVAFALSNKPGGASGDSLFVTNATTDTLGVANVQLRLGDKVGNYVVSAATAGISNATQYFTGTALHGKAIHLNPILPSSISDTIGAKLPAFGAAITDRASNVINGLPVKFSLLSKPTNANGATLLADSLTTDSSGTASTQFVLGDKSGDYLVTASSSSLQGVTQTYSFNATHGKPTNFLVKSGNNQSKQILQPLDTLLTVNLLDRANNVVPNDTISFTLSVPAGATGYALSTAQAVTDSTGIAATQLTLGQKAGTYTVTATSKLLGGSRQFTAIALHGVAKALAYQLGTSQSKQILMPLDTSFVVNVKDIGGNSVSGVGVKFALLSTPSGAWGQMLTVDSVGTDSLGVASTKLKFGSKTGSYTVIATSPYLSDTIRFTGTALVGKPTLLAKQTGDAQIAQIGDVLKPFVVQVQDTGGNNVANTLVTFMVAQRPTLDSSASVTHDSVHTDGSGSASAIFTLGSRPGVYKVRASVPGIIDSVFTAQAIYVEGDANHDNQQNISDLTAIIDHILGKRKLTGYDFIRADMYPVHADGTVGDGVIDIRDAIACRDSLLAGKWDPTRDQTTKSSIVSPKINLSVQNATGTTNSSGSTVSSNIQSAIEMTHIGSRFVLNNTVPIKGLQAVLYLKQPAILDTVDLVFARAQMMSVKVKSIGREVNVLLYNLNNTVIDTGSTAIFRLPVQLSANSVDSVKVIASVDTNISQVIPWASADIRNQIPSTWMLYQNYPNPFNPSTTIEFDVPEITGSLPRVAIQIYDVLGKKVKTIEKDVKDTGRYKVIWDGTNENHTHVATGVYFYRVLAGNNYAATKKMLLLK